VPLGWPPPQVPDENPLTRSGVELGKALFFDPRLSRSATQACAGCHAPSRAFSDTIALSLGEKGFPGLRNAPSLLNVAYHPGLFRDGGAPSLEMQVLTPIHDTLEMNFGIHQAAQRLRDVEPYKTLAHKAYGRVLDGYTITRALASYQRTLLSGRSRYDRYMFHGDHNALSVQEQRGMRIFNGEAGCASCHSGIDLSDHSFHRAGVALAENDPGRERITLKKIDKGHFKTPTLRNVALTAPYMHNGSVAHLNEAMVHARQVVLNGDTTLNVPDLNEADRSDLMAFLMALTDTTQFDMP
jgi:cytochrome c peroxidase